MNTILHSRPWLTEVDVAALGEVVNSEWVGQGERTRRLEHELSAWVGAAGGVGAGSGSAALVLALTALGVGRGAEVVLPSYVCLSVLESVLTVGAEPVLCDVGRDWVVTPRCVAGRVGPRTRALIVPHMYGIFADVESLRTLGVPIVEDAAQALGARGQRRAVGDVVVFSLHPTKCLTSGEGGVAVSNDLELVRAMRALRDGSGGPARPRLFSPLSDLAAALGLSQLARYHVGLERRRALALAYQDGLRGFVPGIPSDEVLGNSMFFRYPLRVAGGLDAFGEAFARLGVNVRRGLGGLLHRIQGLPDSEFATSADLFDTTLSLPLYPALSDDEHRACVRAARQVLSPARADARRT